jgi:predicted porin
MKFPLTVRSLSYLCAGLLLSASAAAQTTITGIVDVFMERTSVPGRSAVLMDSSGLGVSRLVVKSIEEVAPELYVSAYLEGRILVDSGKAAYDGSLFNRMSHLSLVGKQARLTLGKQYSPHLLHLASQYDIFETSFWATPYAIFQGANRYTIIPASVMVQVDTELGKPLRLNAMIADRPLEAGKAPAGRQRFLSALYKLTKELNVGVSVVDDEHFSFANPHARVVLTGFNYNAGRFRISGGIQKIDLLQTGARINEYCIGAGYFLTPRNLLQISHARTYEPGHADRSTAVAGVALVHQMSPRTALYGSIGQLNNKSAYGNSFDLALAPGESSRNVMLGIKHDF